MSFNFRAGQGGLLRAGRRAAIAAALFAALAPAAAQAEDFPSLTTTPSLRPAFNWAVHDYVVRCNSSAVNLQVTLPAGWQGRVGKASPSSTSFTVQRPMTSDSALVVSFNRTANPSARSYYHLRCLPSNFPAFNFVRTAPGGPNFFMMQMNHHYATIFDRNGVPLWWYRARGEVINSQVLRDGTVSWYPANVTGGDLTGVADIRKLNGKLVRQVKTGGNTTTDLHDLQLLANGNYLVTGQVIKDHVDTTAYGGSADASIMGFEVQEQTPAGKVVWKWDSLKYIGLAQTPMRWWNQVVHQPGPYDHQHWNSAEVKGKTMLLSFRNLDAIYAIDRDTGSVAWKLGGTPTPKSLTVLNDPLGSYPLGAQHDARRLPDGTVSIHDNRTGLGPPRAVRYQIDREAQTATLVESISDPDVPESPCCGSARKLPSGDWLIGWGRIPAAGRAFRFVGAYDPSGQRIFQLQLPGGFFYRAFPVPPKAVTAQKLRAAMGEIARSKAAG